MAYPYGGRRVLLRLTNKRLTRSRGPDVRGAMTVETRQRAKRRFKRMAESDLRGPRGRVRKITGRFRKSLTWEPTSRGVSITSNVVYAIKYKQDIRAWWDRSGESAFDDMLRDEVQRAARAARRR